MYVVCIYSLEMDQHNVSTHVKLCLIADMQMIVYSKTTELVLPHS